MRLSCWKKAKIVSKWQRKGSLGTPVVADIKIHQTSSFILRENVLLLSIGSCTTSTERCACETSWNIYFNFFRFPFRAYLHVQLFAQNKILMVKDFGITFIHSPFYATQWRRKKGKPAGGQHKGAIFIPWNSPSARASIYSLH